MCSQLGHVGWGKSPLHGGTLLARATPPSASVSASLRTISTHDTSKSKEDGTGMAGQQPIPMPTRRTGAVPRHPSSSPCAWSFLHWVIQKPRSRKSRKMNALCGEREPRTQVRPVPSQRDSGGRWQ